VARYADNLLADGERVVLRARQHWLATIVEGRTAWAIFAASIVLVFLILQIGPSTARDVVGYVALGLLLVAVLWLVRVYWSWWSEDYLVTNRRVLKVEGILRKRSADSSLEKINDAVLDQSVVGRMLGYGDLDILTAAETSVDQYRMLAGAQQFKRTMLDEKHQLESEFTQMPAPPLRVERPLREPEPPPRERDPASEATAAQTQSDMRAGPTPGSQSATLDGVQPSVDASREGAPGSGEDDARVFGTGTPVDGPDGDQTVERLAIDSTDRPGSETNTSSPSSPSRPSLTATEITKALGDLADLRDRGAISPEDYDAKKLDLLGRL
jgi:hypothetical protein